MLSYGSSMTCNMYIQGLRYAVLKHSKVFCFQSLTQALIPERCTPGISLKPMHREREPGFKRLSQYVLCLMHVHKSILIQCAGS